QALGYGSGRENIDTGGRRCGAPNELNQRNVIDDGVRVGHHDERGDAASGGSTACGSNRFAVLSTRLAAENPRVNKPWKDRLAGRIDNLGTGGSALVQSVRASCSDDAILDDHGADSIHLARRIDDARIGEDGSGHASSPSRRGSRRASRTAMRTATPISTCSWITLCGPSATSEAISTPRFIGP